MCTEPIAAVRGSDNAEKIVTERVPIVARGSEDLSRQVLATVVDAVSVWRSLPEPFLIPRHGIRCTTFVSRPNHSGLERLRCFSGAFFSMIRIASRKRELTATSPAEALSFLVVWRRSQDIFLCLIEPVSAAGDIDALRDRYIGAIRCAHRRFQMLRLYNSQISFQKHFSR